MRDAVVVLTLLGHLALAFGFPLPAPSAAKAQDAGRPFPCQDRPCGCATADECWAGDCCCFTLEQKLAWADVNGIEPPAHVRPLVASRKKQPPAPPPSECVTCCCDADSERPGSQACCPTAEQLPKVPVCDRPSARWVVGLFALKCRGNGAAGQFEFEPAIPPELIADSIPCPSTGTLIALSHRAVSVPHCPPAPPPRRA